MDSSMMANEGSNGSFSNKRTDVDQANSLNLNSNFNLNSEPERQYSNEKAKQSSEIENQFDFRLNRQTISELMEVSIAQMALESGYQQAHQSALDILNDICSDFFVTVTKALRVSVDTEDRRNSDNDFVDCVERAFHQANVSSIKQIHQFVRRQRAIRLHQAEIRARANSNCNPSNIQDEKNK